MVIKDSAVGIGTSSPATALHVNSGTANNAATFTSTDAYALIKFEDNDTTTEQSSCCQDTLLLSTVLSVIWLCFVSKLLKPNNDHNDILKTLKHHRIARTNNTYTHNTSTKTPPSKVRFLLFSIAVCLPNSFPPPNHCRFSAWRILPFSCAGLGRTTTPLRQCIAARSTTVAQ